MSSGDFRMVIGEDKSKVYNIVKDNIQHFRILYSNILRDCPQVVYKPQQGKLEVKYAANTSTQRQGEIILFLFKGHYSLLLALINKIYKIILIRLWSKISASFNCKQSVLSRSTDLLRVINNLALCCVTRTWTLNNLLYPESLFKYMR